MGKDEAAGNEIEEAKTSTRQMVDPVCEYCPGIATVSVGIVAASQAIIMADVAQ